MAAQDTTIADPAKPVDAAIQPFHASPAGTPVPLPAAAADSDTVAAEDLVRIVGRVSVQGNVSTDSLRILRSFEVPSGMRYSPEAVRRGIRKLYALGIFDDMSVDQVPRDTVMDIVIHVVERPRVTRIEFTGNKKKDKDELEKKLSMHVGEPHSAVVVQAQIDSLLKFYRDDGYSQAKIEAVSDTAAGGRLVRFVISEGEKVKITRIRFEGATAFPEKKLRKALKTKQKGFFGGGDVNDEHFAEDQTKLEAWYRDHGYRDARVTGHRLEPGNTPRHLTMIWTVEEGPRYVVGKVTWSGNSVLPAAAVQRYWQPKPGEVYSHARIEKAQGDAYADYAEQGHLYVAVDPRETVRDSAVDIAFNVTEGPPSNVRMVLISGNKATREKVIRRELKVREGDRFRRSALVRSQGDLMRLGFFEEVLPDFTPADSNDVDITFKVKEKTVGTASAGAGYTATDGITGFIELGHNNVLGNGQSVQLHLERGSRRSDYSLSFTEPWFHDTPTLLGFSVFSYRHEVATSTTDITGNYREKRVGGSVQIGRPLPLPDYSRGSLSYSLEDVEIDSLTTLDLATRVALGGIQFGKEQLTSSLTGTFLRNTADHPLYPTHGSKLSLTSDFAGGPFGGSVNFHKHRFEERVYVPSLLKGVTTMFRARIGLLGTYTGQFSAVPAYERFRLGGGTTPDPLRGYDDYMVVPSKFIQDVITGKRFDHIVVVAPGDTDTVYVNTTQRVRYPGGRFMILTTFEQQFPIVNPLHAVLFFDAGNTWDQWREIHPLDLKMGAGIGFRMEIPLLGIVGFDYGYGFNRDDRPRAVGHFLIGQTSF
ncbi:MAG: outer membrane protein assembly factor BamA [Candidatus Eisenbacteria bacterium]|nr:outer membrane protein assembly factor BamA [Candidatus Eisenbacteria bacterium]